MFKVNHKDTIMTQWRRSGVFIVYFQHNSHLGLVFLWLTLYMYLPTVCYLVGSWSRNFFSWDFYWFPNDLKPRRTSDLVIYYVWHYFRTIFFIFELRKFGTFENLEIDFSINLSKCLWTAIYDFETILISG